MQAGNQEYYQISDLPNEVMLFPLSGALLLPGGNMPLNIFEPRYLKMTEMAIAGDRIIGMIQPDPSEEEEKLNPDLCEMGCLGRITGFQETGDGRLALNLSGVCRFSILRELTPIGEVRRAEIEVNPEDLNSPLPGSTNQIINREELLQTFRRYLEANSMETDWEAVEETDDETLVNALCMMSPYGPAEKQALLEADSLRTRADTLVAITEIALAKMSGEAGETLQ